MFHPDLAEFTTLAGEGKLIPVYKEILADLETPVGVLKKLACKPQIFLLESVEGGEKWGRYSFLGFDPHAVLRVRAEEVIITGPDGTTRYDHQGDPLGFLQEYLKRFAPAPVDGLPRFAGGAVGFFSYETLHYLEEIPRPPRDGFDFDEAVFFVTDSLFIFDRLRHTVKIMVLGFPEESATAKEAYEKAINRIGELEALLFHPPPPPLPPPGDGIDLEPTISYDEFLARVRQAKEYIYRGDIIQVVLSQRFQGQTDLDPADLYRALRFVNPSPYLFFFKHHDLVLIGSSPETMVRLEDGQIELRPIAGTKPRGKTEEEDRKLACELLQDPKEKAEHVMLVDLGRNDLGRVSRIGSVQINQLMAVERYSHVMHLVSNIRSQLDENSDAFGVIRATFPAGTLSGAPKVRAMEIISELENLPRGPYGGATGYFSFSGNLDFCITIRTIIMKGRDVYVQAGAGIVADSDPDYEYTETLNKARGMIKAINLAARGFRITAEGG